MLINKAPISVKGLTHHVNNVLLNPTNIKGTTNCGYYIY